MDLSSFKKVYIFSGLNDDELSLLKDVSRIKTFNKGDNIFFDTEPYTGFYIVHKGLVKIYKVSKDGREHILHLIYPFNTFAEVPLLENLGEIRPADFRYPANAAALEDGTEVILMPAMKFTDLISSNPSICLKMLSGLAKRLRHLNRHIEELTLMDVTKRAAIYIYEEYHKNKTAQPDRKNITVNLDISKNDLASYLGTVPETLSRTLKKMQDDGLVQVEGRHIAVLDPDKLKRLTM